MTCPCCLSQCSIRGVADTIQFKFGNSQTNLNLSSYRDHPCFSSGTLFYCPNAVANDDSSFNTEFNRWRRAGRDVNFDGGSGECAKYDGTYIVDLEDVPASAGFNWCTAAWYTACISTGLAAGPYSMGSAISYSVGCDGALAKHTVVGYTVGVEYIASLTRVSKDGPPPIIPPPGPTLLREVISGPDKVASDSVYDWYVSRYRQNFRFLAGLAHQGYFQTSEGGGLLDSPFFCQVTAPELTLE